MNGQPERSSDEKASEQEIERIAEDRRKMIAQNGIDSVLQKTMDGEADGLLHEETLTQQSGLSNAPEINPDMAEITAFFKRTGYVPNALSLEDNRERNNAEREM